MAIVLHETKRLGNTDATFLPSVFCFHVLFIYSFIYFLAVIFKHQADLKICIA